MAFVSAHVIQLTRTPSTEDIKKINSAFSPFTFFGMTGFKQGTGMTFAWGAASDSWYAIFDRIYKHNSKVWIEKDKILIHSDFYNGAKEDFARILSTLKNENLVAPDTTYIEITTDNKFNGNGGYRKGRKRSGSRKNRKSKKRSSRKSSSRKSSSRRSQN
jgi:hypothetical protein